MANLVFRLQDLRDPALEKIAKDLARLLPLAEASKQYGAAMERYLDQAEQAA